MAHPLEQVGAVHRRRVHADAHLAAAGRGDGDVAEDEGLGAAGFVDDNRFHARHRTSGSDVPEMLAGTTDQFARCRPSVPSPELPLRRRGRAARARGRARGRAGAARTARCSSCRCRRSGDATRVWLGTGRILDLGKQGWGRPTVAARSAGSRRCACPRTRATSCATAPSATPSSRPDAHDDARLPRVRRVLQGQRGGPRPEGHAAPRARGPRAPRAEAVGPAARGRARRPHAHEGQALPAPRGEQRVCNLHVSPRRLPRLSAGERVLPLLARGGARRDRRAATEVCPRLDLRCAVFGSVFGARLRSASARCVRRLRVLLHLGLLQDDLEALLRGGHGERIAERLLDDRAPALLRRASEIACPALTTAACMSSVSAVSRYIAKKP